MTSQPGQHILNSTSSVSERSLCIRVSANYRCPEVEGEIDQDYAARKDLIFRQYLHQVNILMLVIFGHGHL